MLQMAMFGSAPEQPANLFRMEMHVLTSLGWRAMGVTAASMVPPLMCLINFSHPAVVEHGCGRTVALLQEGCKNVISKCMKGALPCLLPLPAHPLQVRCSVYNAASKA